MRRPAEKDPRKLIALGTRLAEAKRTLPPDAYDALKRREPELERETKRTLVADKDQRLIRIASIQALRGNVDKLPPVGWSALRELPKLGESALRCLIERGAINPFSTRQDIDRLRSAQKLSNVAARHTGDWERRRA